MCAPLSARAGSKVPVAVRRILISFFLFFSFQPFIFPETFSNDELYLKAAAKIAAVEVVSAEPDRANTFLDPPRLKFKVLRAIRGSMEGQEVSAVWSPPLPFELHSKTGLREWYREKANQPYPPPETGSRWIVILTGPSLAGSYYVDPRCRYLYSKDTFDWVASVIPEYASLKGEKTREEML